MTHKDAMLEELNYWDFGLYFFEVNFCFIFWRHVVRASFPTEMTTINSLTEKGARAERSARTDHTAVWGVHYNDDRLWQ